MRKTLFSVTLLVAAAANAALADDATALTIYSTAVPGAVPAELYRPLPPGVGYGSPQPGQIPGYAVVRQDRDLELAAGRGELRFTDVAAWIDPTTVRFVSLTDPRGTRVLEQDYRFDLVSGEKLLERFIDHEITVEQALGSNVESFSGTLLSASGHLVLRQPDGSLRTVQGFSSIRFPDLPGGLLTRPTLVWDMQSERGGRQRTRVTYETKGITWWADYNLVFTPGENPNRGKLDVGAWVSIVNLSGAAYEDAKLKLIAGDVQRATPPGRMGYPQMEKRMMVAAEADAGFQEQAFFEYHLYTLGRPTTLPDNSTKQLELFDAARGVPAEKLMVYAGAASWFGDYGSPMTDRNFGIEGNTKIDVYLRFVNESAAGLGIPLPSGRIRVNQVDPADDSLEFIGEDVIDHTAKDEKVLIRLGSAFDVVGERRQVDFKIDTARRVMEEEIEIKLRNHKTEAVEVQVKETLYRWTNWEMLSQSHPFEKADARTVHFPVKVAADGETIVTYRVRYTW